jgi:hypothetical protein
MSLRIQIDNIFTAPAFLSIRIQPETWALSMTFFDDAMQAPLRPADKEHLIADVSLRPSTRLVNTQRKEESKPHS